MKFVNMTIATANGCLGDILVRISKDAYNREKGVR